jgi:dTDP-glucose pyrophosphorylase
VFEGQQVKTIQDSPSLTIVDLLTAIEQSASGVVCVLDGQDKLVGISTDGDVRRALLNGSSINDLAEEAINRKPKSCLSSAPPEARRAIFDKFNIRHLPLVSEDGRIIDVLVRDLALHESIPVVIMAGGLGTRIRPLTDHCPKPMLPLGDRPLLEHIIAHLKRDGFRRIYISLGYLPDVITNHFGDGSQFGVSISYLREDQPLGTGGALSLLTQRDFESVLVLNGDVVTDFDFGRMATFHEAEEAAATVCVTDLEVPIRFGVVEARGLQVEGIIEKPTYRHFINVGCYMLSRDALPSVDLVGRLDLPDHINTLVGAKKRVRIFPSTNHWIDIGTHEDYNKLNNRYKKTLELF